MSKKNSRSLFFRFLARLFYNRITCKYLLGFIEKKVSLYLSPGKKTRFSSDSDRIQYERKLMAAAVLQSVKRSIEKKILKREVTEKILQLWKIALIRPRHNNLHVRNFFEENGSNPPFLLVISPGHACNLKCRDCYASSVSSGEKLDWVILNRIISDAKKLWDIKLIVFSGGEPFIYHSNGGNILDLVEKNPDILFLAFTNGTLIDKDIASRIAKYGNLTPAFSVEGMKEATDSRRGFGTFDRVLHSMKLMREAGVPFGISITVSSENYIKVLDNEFLDFFFANQGAFYGFFFQYLPIGRNADFNFMPSPLQRLQFWKRVWEVIERKQLFLIDFWNHGPLVNGCISAGREGGYLYIDWDGKVMPCVFAPYSVGNINDIYDRGEDLNSTWKSPFFKKLREWQFDYGFKKEKLSEKGNLLRPCPYRDHHRKFLEFIKKYSPEPEDKSAESILMNCDYCNNLISYGDELARVFDPVWENKYKKN